jgi:hypothetical protein
MIGIGEKHLEVELVCYREIDASKGRLRRNRHKDRGLYLPVEGSDIQGPGGRPRIGGDN